MNSAEVAALSCQHLVRLYDTDAGRVQAVRGVDLEVKPGRLVAVAGPSGCGKSSLLGMLAGIDTPTAGFVQLAGVDLDRVSARARARVRAELVTFIHQRPADNLLAHLDVEQQLARVARRDDAGFSVDEALSELGLDVVRHARPSSLSGGEQQRLAVARCLVSRHPVVIADEPTSQLDAPNAARVIAGLRALARRGTTVVLASHDPRVLAEVDQIIRMRDGTIAEIEEDGVAHAVIDRTGRVQLPPEIRARFPARRVLIEHEPDGVRLREP